jgi:hypothetical protein
MKSTYQLALLATLGLASATAAEAQYASGDLLVSVYQQGVANTETLDLGSLATLQSEGSVNLTTYLLTAGFSSTLNTSSAIFSLTGYTTSGAVRDIFLSTPGNTPDPIANLSAMNVVRSPISTLANNQGAQTVNGGLDYYTSLQIGTGGLTDSLGYNPSTSVLNTADLWTIADNGSAPALDGTLSLNPSTEVLSFTPTPEPATYGLIAGGGLLMLLLRNRSRRKRS